jgi:drug/metabolite transporter (DMT)-like permease
LKFREREIAVFAALFAAQVAFGVFPVIGKVALASIPPLPFAFFRVAGASLLLWAIRKIRRPERIAREDLPRVFLLALLGVSLNQIFFIEGLSLSTAINAALLMTTIPVMTLAIAIMAGREAPTPRSVFGCLLAFGGAVSLLGAARFDWKSDLFLGDVLLLTNAAAYSLYLVLSRDLLRKYSAGTFIHATFLAGAFPVLLFAALPLARMDFTAVTGTAWVCLAAVVLLPSVAAYLLNAWALARTHASRVALFVAVQPVVATALAVVWLDEKPTLRTVASALLILAGLLVSRPPLPRRNV